MVQLFTADAQGRVLTKRLGNRALFTSKFLFDLTVVISELSRANPPHLVVWILAQDVSGQKGRKKETRKRPCGPFDNLLSALAGFSEFK